LHGPSVARERDNTAVFVAMLQYVIDVLTINFCFVFSIFAVVPTNNTQYFKWLYLFIVSWSFVLFCTFGNNCISVKHESFGCQVLSSFFKTIQFLVLTCSYRFWTILCNVLISDQHLVMICFVTVEDGGTNTTVLYVCHWRSQGIWFITSCRILCRLPGPWLYMTFLRFFCTLLLETLQKNCPLLFI